MKIVGCQPKNQSMLRVDCATCGNEYDDDNCLNARLSEPCELICDDSLYSVVRKFRDNRTKTGKHDISSTYEIRR